MWYMCGEQVAAHREISAELSSIAAAAAAASTSSTSTTGPTATLDVSALQQDAVLDSQPTANATSDTARYYCYLCEFSHHFLQAFPLSGIPLCAGRNLL